MKNQERLKNIIEIYKNSTEIGKLVIEDSINDLFHSMDKINQEIKENTPKLQGIHFKKLAENFVVYIQEELKGISQDEMKKNLLEAKKDISNITKLRTDKSFTLFNITKEKTVYPRTEYGKSLMEYYGGIGDVELEEIQYFRNLFIQNLIAYDILEEYEVEDGNLLGEFISDLIKQISKKGNDGKRVMKDISEIKDRLHRTNFSYLRSVFGNDKLKEYISYFLNDMKIGWYYVEKSDIEYLYKNITGHKIEPPISSIEHVGDKILLRYNQKELEFEKGKKPYIILEHLYKTQNKGEFLLGDIFPYIFPGEEYSAKKNAKEKKQISNIIGGINRRFEKISNGNKLILFKDNKITKLR